VVIYHPTLEYKMTLPATYRNSFSKTGAQAPVCLSCVRPHPKAKALMNSTFLPLQRSFMLECAIDYFTKNIRKFAHAIAFYDQWTALNRPVPYKNNRPTSASISLESMEGFFALQEYDFTRDELLTLLWVAACQTNLFPGIHKLAAQRISRAHKAEAVSSEYKMEISPRQLVGAARR
jgi:hypothetical protein